MKRNFIADKYLKYCKYSILLVLFVIPLFFINCNSSSLQEPALDEVILQLKWTHQAQFAGFYIADDEGYYRDENIKVTFLEGGQNIDSAQRLLSGEADFAVLAPEFVLVGRSQDEPLVAIATIYRRSAVLFVAMIGSGIVRPSDMVGRTIALTNEQGAIVDLEIQFYALMKRLGLDYSTCHIVNHDPTYQTFYSREVDVTVTYVTGGLARIRQIGYQLNTIWPSDYGIHFYSDTLVTTENMIQDNPELVTRFLRASLKGWQDTIEDYEGAVAVTMKYANNSDVQLQTAMMESQLPLVHTGEDYIGWMKPAVWEDTYNILLDQGLLGNQFDIKDAYTMRFLEEIYGVESP